MHRKLLRSFFGLALIGLTLVACDDDPVVVVPDLGTPGTPSVAVDGTSATVTWTAAAEATGYTVSVTGGGSTMSQDVTATEATFDDLSEGVTYVAQVTAKRGTETNNSAAVSFTIDVSVVAITDDILTNTTWTSDKTYILRGPIFVGRDIAGANGVAATLTIEPGTTILGDVNPPQGSRGSYLVVTRGSKIIADANANKSDKSAKPAAEDVIVFTSSAARGSRRRGDWGGLVINGRAPTNAGAEASGEGESGLFGGTDVNDNSGILRGVRVEFAGDQVTATDELNGIAFQGVGAGTTVDYVQIHYNVDDGTEPFGGTVSQTHMVMTGIGDDAFDGTDGYRGFIQFGIAQMRGDEGDKAMELSTSGDDPTGASPRSTAVIANVTAVGAGSGAIGDLGNVEHRGLDLREGSNYRVYNSIIAGFQRGAVNVDGSTQPYTDNYMAGQTTPESIAVLANSILWNNSTLSGYNATFANFAASANMIVDGGTQFLPTAAFNVGTMASPPNFIPDAMPTGYTAMDVSGITAGLVPPTDGRALQATTYAGAVAPGTSLADAWYTGWTVWATDGSDSRPNEAGN